MRILLIEDNTLLAGNIVDYLDLKGHHTDYASNAKQCFHCLAQYEYDVLLLDVMLPGADGFELCTTIRQDLLLQTPILFLTAKAELNDKLSGFAAGGDDYLTKPFALEELYARLSALAVRGKRSDVPQLSFADLHLNLREGTAQREDKQFKLNNVQVQILKHLIQAAPAPVSRRELEYAIWQEAPPETNALRVHVYQLRRLIDKPFQQPYIETIHGVGYRMLSTAARDDD